MTFSNVFKQKILVVLPIPHLCITVHQIIHDAMRFLFLKDNTEHIFQVTQRNPFSDISVFTTLYTLLCTGAFKIILRKNRRSGILPDIRNMFEVSCRMLVMIFRGHPGTLHEYRTSRLNSLHNATMTKNTFSW